jgi:hypothetical protein
MEIEREDYREPNRTKPLMEMFTEWHTEGSRNYRRTACRTECRTTLPEAYQMTTEKPSDILPKLSTEMATEKLTKNAPKRKKDSLQMKQKPNRITCQIREISITIRNHDYTVTEPRWQSTIDIFISRRQSNEFSKGRDSYVYTIKSYRQVEAHQ